MHTHWNAWRDRDKRQIMSASYQNLEKYYFLQNLRIKSKETNILCYEVQHIVSTTPCIAYFSIETQDFHRLIVFLIIRGNGRFLYRKDQFNINFRYQTIVKECDKSRVKTAGPCS